MLAGRQVVRQESVLTSRTTLAGLCLMLVSVLLAGLLFLYASGSFESYPYLFLLPWLMGLSAVMAAPSVYLIYKGRFSLADPIVFATWSYFFPAFVVGGLLFA